MLKVLKCYHCEQFFLSSQFYLLTLHLAEMEVFLNGLTDDCIDDAITHFREGLISHKFLHRHFDPGCAQTACQSIF